MVDNGLSFVGRSLVKGVNDLVSEFVQLLDDLSHDSLVREVLLGQHDQGLDQSGLFTMGLDLGLDLL